MVDRQKNIRIVFADDHAIFRDGLKMLLSRLEGVEVAGEAANGKELLELVDILNPDVVITDVQMPVLDGISAIRKIRESNEDLPVLVMSSFSERSLIQESISAGANGYLLKSVSSSELIAALRAVHAGGSYFDQEVSKQLRYFVVEGPGDASAAGRENMRKRFSDQEILVVKQICEGRTTKESANALGLSLRSVEGKRAKILEKLDGQSVMDIVRFALRNGIYKW